MENIIPVIIANILQTNLREIPLVLVLTKLGLPNLPSRWRRISRKHLGMGENQTTSSCCWILNEVQANSLSQQASPNYINQVI